MRDDSKEMDDEMLPEYDFDQMSGPVHVGKYYDRYQRAKQTRVLDAELSERFRDDESVNQALREYLRLTKETA